MSIFRLITGCKLYHGIFASVQLSVDKCEKNIEIVISSLANLVKDQVRRLSSLGVSTIALSDISTSAAEVKKVKSGEFPKDHLNLGLAALDSEGCCTGKKF